MKVDEKRMRKLLSLMTDTHVPKELYDISIVLGKEKEEEILKLQEEIRSLNTNLNDLQDKYDKASYNALKYESKFKSLKAEYKKFMKERNILMTNYNTYRKKLEILQEKYESLREIIKERYIK